MSEKNLAAVLERVRTAESTAHVGEVLRAVARKLVGADGITFVVREGNCCRYLEEDAVSPLWKGQTFPLNECVSGWVMMTGTVASIPDIYTDPRVPVHAYRPTFVRSMAMVPVGRAPAVAAIGAYWATPHQPTENELELLQAMAESAALALQE